VPENIPLNFTVANQVLIPRRKIKGVKIVPGYRSGEHAIVTLECNHEVHIAKCRVAYKRMMCMQCWYEGAVAATIEFNKQQERVNGN
jgi:hypothetical protein